jgi:LytS/YehU family sensor histidine kinase
VLLKHYLTIESIRLGPRLEVTMDIPEACLDAPVPTLILQPLVENAIVHAIARRRTPGKLNISAQRRDRMLCIQISNSRGPDGGRGDGNGLGLELVTRRLELMYGARSNLECIDTDAETYTVVLKMPVPATAPDHELNSAVPC